MKNIKILVLAFIAGMSGAFVFSRFFGKNEVYLNQTISNPTMLASHQSTGNFTDFTAASSASTASVVFIKTESGGYNNSGWFDWYFNWGNGQQASSGSGVIYSSNGYIITNFHVVEKAEKIEVIHEKRSYSARLVGTDPSTDLALLKVEAENLPAIRIGSAKELKVGEWVLAVGNPFNLASTVTAGIVSAKARHINVVNSQFPIESFIQTDAAINPGNSGGALVNIRGELVGINTAILSKTGSYTGYGFAVPVDIVTKVVKDLIKYGEVQKAFFGGEVAEINSAVADQYNLDNLNGVMVSYLQKEGAAENAGILKGDIILKINETEVNTKSNFDELLSYHSPGDKINVVIKRNKEVKTIPVTLTNREGTTSILKRETVKSEKLGADFEAISKVEKDKLGIGHGVRILNVRGAFLRRMGLDEGFIVTTINKVQVKTPEELIYILENARGYVSLEGITPNGVKAMYTFYF